MLRKYILLPALLFLISNPCFAQGKYREFDVPEEVVVAGKSLKLNGVAVYRRPEGDANYLITMYLERRSSSPQDVIDSDQLKRVRLYILEPITYRKAKKILFEDVLVNLSQSELDDVSVRLSSLLGVTPKDGFKAGDWVHFDYLPGRGTEVALSTSVSGIIEGKDFYAALLKQWIGPLPVSRSLKKEILGAE